VSQGNFCVPIEIGKYSPNGGFDVFNCTGPMRYSCYVTMTLYLLYYGDRLTDMTEPFIIEYIVNVLEIANITQQPFEVNLLN